MSAHTQGQPSQVIKSLLMTNFMSHEQQQKTGLKNAFVKCFVNNLQIVSGTFQRAIF